MVSGGGACSVWGRRLAVCVQCVWALWVSAESEPHKKGRFAVTFEKRSPLSALEEMEKRKLGEDINPKVRYELKDLTFEVLVPDSYEPSKPSALFIWVSSGDGGGPPGQLVSALGKHNTIFVGANQTGNEQPVVKRIGAAIDAAHNMPLLYNIDTNRIYISGNSGGGRCASEAAIVFSDVFTGGAFYVIGCNHYDNIPVGDGSNKFYPGFWPEKNKKLLALAKDHYFVFLTGSKDMNRLGTIGTCKAYGQDRFEHCKYIEVPDMGHSTPPAEYFEEGFTFLDGVLVEAGKKAMAQALRLLPMKKFPEAAALLAQAKAAGVEEAQTHLDKIKAGSDAETAAGLKCLEAKNLAQASAVFQKVIRAYGELVAVRAKEELSKLESTPEFIAERTAAERFQQIRGRFQSDGKAKTAAALKQLIEEYAGTEAAEKAKGVLKNMGG